MATLSIATTLSPVATRVQAQTRTFSPVALQTHETHVNVHSCEYCLTHVSFLGKVGAGDGVGSARYLMYHVVTRLLVCLLCLSKMKTLLMFLSALHEESVVHVRFDVK